MPSSRRHARPGELSQAYLRIAKLEQELEATKSALERCRQSNLVSSESPAVSVEWSSEGFLLIHLPGAHTIRWAVGSTQSDYALTFNALVQLLRRRKPGSPNPIGSPGAPTAADLRALAAATRKSPTRVAPKARVAPTREETDTLTLSDLDL
jgi:hypothetical protein